MGKQSQIVVVSECTYCGSTAWHVPMNTTKYCIKCGAEWEPVAVPHNKNDVVFSPTYKPSCPVCHVPHTDPVYDDGDLCIHCEDNANRLSI